jgi:hypothetical protein
MLNTHSYGHDPYGQSGLRPVSGIVQTRAHEQAGGGQGVEVRVKVEILPEGVDAEPVLMYSDS